jgi:hypothetical protein
MKKALTILMILLALGSVAFAKGGFTVSVGGSYDFVNLKAVDFDGEATDEYFRGHAFGVAAGVTYNFSDHFLAYYDGSLGLVAGQEFDYEGLDNFTVTIATTHHAGVGYDFNMDKLDLQVGAGLALSYAGIFGTGNVGDTTGSMTIGISSFGVGLYGKVGYKLSEGFSVGLTVHPDFMFVSADVASATETKTVGKATQTTTQTLSIGGTAFSFKCNAAVGVTFKF